MFANILVLTIGVCILTVFFYYIEKKIERHFKKVGPIDKLMKSQKHLKKYKNLSPRDRLENYEDLRLAIRYLRSVVMEVDGDSYDLQGVLNRDYLHTDVRMLNYYKTYGGTVDFVSLNEAKFMFDYPQGKFEIIDPYIGKYIKNGVEKASLSISVDTQLIEMCDRWLNQISKIEALTAGA